MKEYLDICRYVLANGTKRLDRTGTGTISCFGYQTSYDLQKGFPLLTTKKVHFKSVAYELLWFIAGRTDLRYLAENKVRIWNEWPYQKYKQSSAYRGETMDQFLAKVLSDDAFSETYGDLGPVYGHQWRDFDGVDQLSELLDGLINNPFSRRHIITAWHPSENEKMALMPCHALVQFYVSSDQKELSLQLYQRSADLFLGVPFNIASYALLLMMICEVTGYKPGKMVHTFGDVHIYLDHLDKVKLQLERTPRPLPTLRFARKVDKITDFKYEDLILENYDPYDKIPGKVSV